MSKLANWEWNVVFENSLHTLFSPFWRVTGQNQCLIGLSKSNSSLCIWFVILIPTSNLKKSISLSVRERTLKSVKRTRVWRTLLVCFKIYCTEIPTGVTTHSFVDLKTVKSTYDIIASSFYLVGFRRFLVLASLLIATMVPECYAAN